MAPIVACAVNGNSVITWLRGVAPIVAVVGAAWALNGHLERIEAKVEHNADLLQRNAVAIQRNAQALERTAAAMDKLQESMALLNGLFAEHTRSMINSPAASPT